MAQTETFQLSAVAAEAYESTFVPALFAEWAPHLCDLAGVRPGQRVLDVAGPASSPAWRPTVWRAPAGSSESI